MASHECEGCGRFALPPQTRLCYWCATPRESSERHERVMAGVHVPPKARKASWAELEAKERQHREKLRQGRIRRRKAKEGP